MHEGSMNFEMDKEIIGIVRKEIDFEIYLRPKLVQ